MLPSNNEIMIDNSSEFDPPLSESYQLRYGDDIDWIDVHKVYERDSSVKETTNPKSHSHLHNSKNVGSTSQRFSGNLMPGIIGLPGSIQNSSILGHSARRPSGLRIIPPKNGGKLSGLESEPRSPKVSCMGKVLSEKPKGQSHTRQKSRPKKTPKSAGKNSSKPTAEKTLAKPEHKGPGCLIRMARIFCSRKKRAMDMVDESICLEKGNDCSVSASTSVMKDAKIKGRRFLERNVDAKETVIVERERDTPVPVPVPGIGGTKRFASGRKVDWNFEEETNNSSETKEEKSSEKDADEKQRSSLEIDNDTPVPVLVLGLGGLKRFASGRKVDWNFDAETDGRNLANVKCKENNKLESDDDGDDDDANQKNSFEKENDTAVGVPVFGISVMKKFASGRKLDWNFELETNEGCTEEGEKESKASEKSADNNETDTLVKETGTPLPVTILGINMMKRFSSGRKVDCSFEVETDEGCIAKEGKENKTSKKDDNVNERDTLVAMSVPGISTTKRFASGRKVDCNFKLEPDNTTTEKETDTLKRDDDVKVTNTSEKENHTPMAVSTVPRIGSMMRFASGRKVDWNFEVESDNLKEAEKNIDPKENDGFKSGRKLYLISKVKKSKAQPHKSGMK